MKKINNIKQLACIAFLFFLFASCTNSADETQWAKYGGGESYDGGRALVTDSEGNIFVIGRFQGSANFDGKKIIGQGDDGIFLLKYNSTGKVLWAKELGGKKEDSGYSIDIDSQNNLYITGYFEDTGYFDSHVIICKGEYDAFLAKCNSDGKILWVKQAGGIFNDVGRSVALDEKGNCLMAGFFTGAIFLDADSLVSNGFHEDIFIAKYNPDGKILWTKRAGGKSDDRAISIASCKNGNFFLSGFFNGVAMFDSAELVSNGRSDVFVAMYDENGNALWAKQFGSSGIDETRGMNCDEQNNVYITGFFVNYIKMSASSDEILSAGDRDMFVAKYDEKGNWLWTQNGGGKKIDEGSAVGIGNSGECVVTGFFGDSASFGDKVLSPVGGNDIFVAHYSSDGKLLCLSQMGSNKYDEGRAVASDGKGNFIIAGNYLGSLQIENTALPHAKGDGDMFIAKIKDKCNSAKGL